MVCNHYYFKDKFDYQPYVCNVMILSDFFILNIGGNDYRVYISGIDKEEAMIILKKISIR